MFNTGFNPTSNLGFSDRFRMGQVYSPSLARTDYTPGMVQMQQPMPTPGGGAAPGMPSTANGIGGASVPPGAAGSLSPGNIMAQQAPPPQGVASATLPQAGAVMGALTPQQALSLANMGGQIMAQANQQPQMPVRGADRAPQGRSLQHLMQAYGIQGLLGG